MRKPPAEAGISGSSEGGDSGPRESGDSGPPEGGDSGPPESGDSGPPEGGDGGRPPPGERSGPPPGGGSAPGGAADPLALESNDGGKYAGFKQSTLTVSLAPEGSFNKAKVFGPRRTTFRGPR